MYTILAADGDQSTTPRPAEGFFDGTHLLVNFTLGKDVFKRNIELAEIVLAKPIVIPADTFQQRDSNHGHFEGNVPFWVEGLENRRGRLSRISECNYQILDICQSGMDSNGGGRSVGGGALTGSLVPPRSFAARFLPFDIDVTY